jgi:hypothetical protein
MMSLLDLDFVFLLNVVLGLHWTQHRMQCQHYFGVLRMMDYLGMFSPIPAGMVQDLSEYMALNWADWRYDASKQIACHKRGTITCHNLLLFVDLCRTFHSI